MLLYRALNHNDMINYNEGKPIYCSLFNSTKLSNVGKISKNRDTYYDLCFRKKCAYALDLIVGHISGKGIGVNVSPWVSTSTDFDYTACEYAVPQAGNFNYQHERKPILVIDIPDNIVLNKSDDIKNIRNTLNKDFAIDLTNDKLNTYYDSGAVSSEKYNNDMPGYDPVADINKEMGYTTSKVTGFSNFATASSEVLVYGGIDTKYHKIIIYPILQDIIYSCNIDMKYIITNYNRINTILEELQPYYNWLYKDYKTGINLTDYLLENYDIILGNNIEEKYNNLKLKKQETLNNIITILNNKLNTNFKISKLVDDKILVCNYNNISKLSDKLVNDLLIIECDNNLLTYSNETKKYSNGIETKTKGDIISLTKKKAG